MQPEFVKANALCLLATGRAFNSVKGRKLDPANKQDDALMDQMARDLKAEMTKILNDNLTKDQMADALAEAVFARINSKLQRLLEVSVAVTGESHSQQILDSILRICREALGQEVHY